MKIHLNNKVKGITKINIPLNMIKIYKNNLTIKFNLYPNLFHNFVSQLHNKGKLNFLNNYIQLTLVFFIKNNFHPYFINHYI